MVVLAIAQLAAAGCRQPERDGLLMHAQPYIKPVYEQVISDFGKQHPEARMRFEAGPREEEQLIQQLLRSNLIGAPLPDVVMISGNYVRLLAERGLAVPLDEFIADRPQWRESVSDAVIEAGRNGNSTYGLAFGFSLPVVLFNSELVRKAGADPQQLPTEWADILELARRIDSPERGVVGGLLEYDGSGAFGFLTLLESHGGTLLTADERRLSIDNEAGQRALAVVQGFGRAGQARADMSRDQARQAFGAGSVGVFVTMSSTLPRLTQAASQHFAIGIVALPLVSTHARLPTAGPVAVLLARDPDRQRLAFELMTYLTSSEAQQALVASSGYVPANARAIETSVVLRELLDRSKYSATVIEQLGVATRWYAPPGPNAIRIADRITSRLQQVVTLKQEPALALEELAAEIEPLLPRPAS